jgi:hypothetical protein
MAAPGRSGRARVCKTARCEIGRARRFSCRSARSSLRTLRGDGALILGLSWEWLVAVMPCSRCCRSSTRGGSLDRRGSRSDLARCHRCSPPMMHARRSGAGYETSHARGCRRIRPRRNLFERQLDPTEPGAPTLPYTFATAPVPTPFASSPGIPNFSSAKAAAACFGGFYGGGRTRSLRR